MNPIENTTDFRIRRFLLRLFAPFALAWIGVSGIAFVASAGLILNDRSFLGLVLLFSLFLGPVLYLVAALRLDFDRLARLPLKTLAVRSILVILACFSLPKGCSYFANNPGKTEREMQAYFVAHRSELNQLIQLHQADPTLQISKKEGYWYECTGRPETILRAKEVADLLYPAVEIESSREPFELRVVLQRVEGFPLDVTKRGLIHRRRLAEFDALFPPSADFDRIDEYNVRYLRSISDGWSMFHYAKTD